MSSTEVAVPVGQWQRASQLPIHLPPLLHFPLPRESPLAHHHRFILGRSLPCLFTRIRHFSILAPPFDFRVRGRAPTANPSANRALLWPPADPDQPNRSLLQISVAKLPQGKPSHRLLYRRATCDRPDAVVLTSDLNFLLQRVSSSAAHCRETDTARHVISRAQRRFSCWKCHFGSSKRGGVRIGKSLSSH